MCFRECWSKLHNPQEVDYNKYTYLLDCFFFNLCLDENIYIPKHCNWNPNSIHDFMGKIQWANVRKQKLKQTKCLNNKKTETGRLNSKLDFGYYNDLYPWSNLPWVAWQNDSMAPMFWPASLGFWDLLSVQWDQYLNIHSINKQPDFRSKDILLPILTFRNCMKKNCVELGHGKAKLLHCKISIGRTIFFNRDGVNI